MMEIDRSALEVTTLATAIEPTKGIAELPNGELVIATKSAVWLLEAQDKLVLHVGHPLEAIAKFGPRLEARFKELGAVRYLEFGDDKGLFIVDRDASVVSFLRDEVLEPYVGVPGKKGRVDGSRSPSTTHNKAVDHTSQSAVVVDGPRNQTATLYFPTDVTVFRDCLFISDYSSSSIRMVTPSGMVTSIGGQRQDPSRVQTLGTFLDFEFRTPFGLVATEEALFVSEHTQSRITKINLAQATVSTVTGAAPEGCSDGNLETASWNMIRGICADSQGNLYCADCSNNLIRQISDTEAKTVLGKKEASEQEFTRDGPLLQATLQRPFFLHISNKGDLIWTEEFSQKVRCVRGFAAPKLTFKPSYFLPICLPSSSSPLASMFTTLQLPSFPFTLQVIPALVQLTLPQIEDLPIFADQCPQKLHSALPAFFGLLQRSHELLPFYTSLDTIITAALVIQLLALAGINPEKSALGAHLLSRFTKAICSRPLHSILSLISSCHCASFDPILTILLRRLSEFPVQDVDNAIASSDAPETLPFNLTELRSALSPPQVSPQIEPFSEIDSSLQALLKSVPQASSFVIRIEDTPIEVVVADWVLASQWTWFRALLESGLNETFTRRLDLPSQFPPALLTAIIAHLHYGNIDPPSSSANEVMDFIESKGGQFGLVDLSGVPISPFRPVIDKFRMLSLLEPPPEHVMAVPTLESSKKTKNDCKMM